MAYAEKYQSLIAQTYDDVYSVIRDPSGDVAFYVAQAAEAGGPVLEIGCGTGRILIPTARIGIECIGSIRHPRCSRCCWRRIRLPICSSSTVR